MLARDTSITSNTEDVPGSKLSLSLATDWLAPSANEASPHAFSRCATSVRRMSRVRALYPSDGWVCAHKSVTVAPFRVVRSAGHLLRDSK